MCGPDPYEHRRMLPVPEWLSGRDVFAAMEAAQIVEKHRAELAATLHPSRAEIAVQGVATLRGRGPAPVIVDELADWQIPESAVTRWEDPTADPIRELADTIEQLRGQRYPVAFEVSPATAEALRACRSDAERLRVVDVLLPPLAVGVHPVTDVEDGKVRVTFSNGDVEILP